MSIVVLRTVPASHIRPEQRLRRGDGCNSVYEARWLLGPIFALAIILAAVGLLA
jgi:hypothetical protein